MEAKQRKRLTRRFRNNSTQKASDFFSIVVDAVGFKKTRELASEKVSPGGVITHIGLGEDLGGIDVRRIGAGSQILRDLGVEKITLMGSKTRYPSISGFGLEVVKYIQK